MKQSWLITLMAGLIVLCGCTRPEKAKVILEADGYTDINVGGYSWFGCGNGDTFATIFSAHKNGREILGVVCDGVLKGATVRITRIKEAS